MNENWHAKTALQALSDLKTNQQGLDSDEVARRLKEFGPNKLPEQKGKSLIVIFFEQFKSPLIYVLLGADAVVFFLKEFTDALIILFILLFNSVLGTIQEGRAQNTLEALKKFVETRAEVLRGGQEFSIPDTEVVPGDIILLQEGEKIPADARLIETHNLKTIEAALTGESEPVRKIIEPISGDNLQTAEKKNMLFKGTTVAVGSGKALVVATGINTVIGKISQSIAGINTEIPLAKNLKQLAKTVVIIVGVLTAVLFSIGIIEGRELKEMFVSAVAIAVAAVPEGLPLVLTVTLATGVWRMAKRRVLVKKLQAVEALGQAQKIAVDKTGTITKNELVIQKVIAGTKEFDIQGIGYEPKPEINNPDPELDLAARIAAFCSNAHIAFSNEEKEYRLVGDPTEGAMETFAWKTGLPKDKLLKEYESVNDWPFDYQKKLHAALYKKDGKNFFAVTGAPEIIIKLCSSSINEKMAAETFTEEAKEKMEKRFLELSEQGLRVIGFAFNDNAEENSSPENLPKLTFGGMFAMRDALRVGIKEQVEAARNAGIRVIMITGDHAITAKTIARQAGIYNDGDLILTGEDIDKLPENQLFEELEKASVFARVTPEHKMKIIQSYKKQGEIIAMTGDGVNDAPSLVAADLGIAMGKIGTEVAKEASDLVLLDDNFGDILNAVEEGRNMRQGIRRTITYLFSSNLGEIILIAISLLVKHPLPLLAAQIVWMNVVTDTFFDISLSLEPKTKSLLRKGIKLPKKLFDKIIAIRLSVIAPTVALGSFWIFQSQIEDPTRARTLALTSLIIFQWFNSLNCRSEDKSVFTMNPFSNKFLTITLVLVMALHVFAVYNPFMNNLLGIKPLYLNDWIKMAAVASSVLFVEEIRKFFSRKSSNLKNQYA